MISILARIDKFIESLAKSGLVVCIALMLGLTLINIVLRWFGNTWLWVDPTVRHMVFVCAFLGGTLATGTKNHIRIDLVSRYLEARRSHTAHKIIETIVAVVCFVTVVWLVISGIDLAKVEFEFGKAHFLNIHSGFLVSIIPVGLSLIAYRFFFSIIANIVNKE